MGLHGVALVDKPAGMSSFSVVSRLRRAFKPLGVTKAGHTGTLDPLATGLLPICIGESTKFAQRLLDSEKGYVATVQFGVATTTGDAEGEVSATNALTIAAGTLEAVLPQFRGVIQQVPPAYSALKIDGKPAYAYARAGQAVTLAAREVTIHQLELQSFDSARQVAQFEVRCSKGTYIRTLAEDIAVAAGTVAHLLALRRTRTGTFDLANARPLDEWMTADDDARRSWVLPTDQLVGDLPTIGLDAPRARDLCNGKVVAIPAHTAAAGLLRAYDTTEQPPRFLGLVTMDASGALRAERLLSTQKASSD